MSYSLAYRRRQCINGQHDGCIILSFSFPLCGGYCTPEPSAKEILACLHQKSHFPSGSQSSEGLLTLCAATVTFQLINVYQETPFVLCFCIAEQIPEDLCICTQRQVWFYQVPLHLKVKTNMAYALHFFLNSIKDI